MAKGRKDWTVGSVFSIQLSDKNLVFGQVLSIEREALNSFVGAFYPVKLGAPISPTEFDGIRASPVSVQFVTREALDSAEWTVLFNSTALHANDFFNMGKLRAQGFVGTEILNSMVIALFYEAFFGFYPWNGFANPKYLDTILLDQKYKPKNIMVKK